MRKQDRYFHLSEEIKQYKIPRLGNDYPYINPPCCKIINRTYNDWKNSVTYLNLRELDCSKPQSLLFATKKRCRVDTTKLQGFGPTSCRIIKLKESTIKHSYNGWASGNDVEFDVGQPNEMMIDNLNERLHKKQDGSVRDFIARLDQYIIDKQTVDEKHNYSLRKQGKKTLYEKLRVMNHKSGQRSPQNIPQLPLSKSTRQLNAILKRHTLVNSFKDSPQTEETQDPNTMDDGSLVLQIHRRQQQRNMELQRMYT